MYAFKIQGGNRLFGTVEINGAKNAILPIMAAALLTAEPVKLENISYLSDVKVLSQLLNSMGMKIQNETDSITLRADDIVSTHADYEYVSKMRGSFWVLGPLLGRFHKAEVSLPGGCAIGTRPVDLYLMALREMGAEIKIENGYVCATGPLHGAEIFFPKVSVGATHNTVMAAVLMCEVPELGKLSHNQIAKLIGVAPLNRESGMMRGKSKIYGGRGYVRDNLYLAALPAIRFEPILRDFYLRLKNNGKPGKLAVIAVVHKMITILNARLRDFYA